MHKVIYKRSGRPERAELTTTAAIGEVLGRLWYLAHDDNTYAVLPCTGPTPATRRWYTTNFKGVFTRIPVTRNP